MPLEHVSPLLCWQKQRNLFCIEIWYAHVHTLEQNLATLRDAKYNYDDDDGDNYKIKVIRYF